MSSSNKIKIKQDTYITDVNNNSLEKASAQNEVETNIDDQIPKKYTFKVSNDTLEGNSNRICVYNTQTRNSQRTLQENN